MDSEQRRDSAAILPFPPGGRPAPPRKASERKETAPVVPSGRGWYHDVAIREATDARDRKPSV